MKLITLPVGPLQANCYLVSDGATPACAVIDPGGEAGRLLGRCEREELKPELILLTHGHADHMAAAAAVKEATGARLMIHAGDRNLVRQPHPFWSQMVGGAPGVQPDEMLADGQQIQVGGLTCRVLHTPGHSPGCVCLLTDHVAFTGDTLFAGSVGRTDLPDGDLRTLERSLRRLVEATDPQTTVYPGHGPQTTIAAELADNPWLQELA